jgi:hypothetical protein
MLCARTFLRVAYAGQLLESNVIFYTNYVTPYANWIKLASRCQCHSLKITPAQYILIVRLKLKENI